MHVKWTLAGILMLVLAAFPKLVNAQNGQPVPANPINTTTCSAQNPSACVVWTPSQWVAAWGSKADANNGALTNPTITGGAIAGATISSPTWSGNQSFTNGLSVPGWSTDVRVWGAVCDGSTNDSTAFQNAINSLGNTGGRIQVPATGHGCYLGTGISISSASLSGTILEGVAGTYFPGFADNTQADWTPRGSWIICGDTVNACITQSGNGSIVRNLNFWYTQPTPPSAATCVSPCTMTHNWTPTTYPYTILITSPQNFNAVENVTIVNATHCIDVEGPSNGVGTFFTHLEHLNLGCFINGITLHRVDNPPELHDINFNLLWYQASSDVLGYTQGDSTHTGHRVDLSLKYASGVHLSGVRFVQPMVGIYTEDATVTNGLGALTFGAQALVGEGIEFIQPCQAMTVQNSTTTLQGRFTNVAMNIDPQTSSSTQCAGYLPSAFDLSSNNVEFGITNLDGLFANTVATIGGGTGGVLHIKGGSHATNYSAFTNGRAAFVVNAGAALDVDNINEYFSNNGSAGPHISGDPNWPQTVPGGTTIEGPTLTARQQCYALAKTTSALSTNQWCWVDDSTASANFGLYRFNTTTGAFVDIPLAVTSSSGLVSFADGISVNTLKGIQGTVVADSANAGSVGEVISNTGSVSLTSATAAATTSVSLTPGDWDVDCAVNFQPSATALSTLLMTQVNTTVALAGSSVNAGSLNIPFTVAPAPFNTVIAPRQRENISVTTTVYCVANTTYTGSSATMTGAGSIRARRMR